MSPREQKSVLITGGQGFIGRAVTKLLQRSGYRVLSADRISPSASADGYSSTDQEISLDITNTEALRRMFQANPIAAIVHLAAILPTSAGRDPAQATQINIEGSLNLLEMARQFGARRFVFGSSLSVYGTCPPDQVVSEADRAAPEDLYGAAKLYVEQLGEAYRQSHGLEFVSLRIGRVVGAGAQSVTSAWRSQIFELLTAGSADPISFPYVGSEKLLLVDVDDVAAMLVTLLLAAQPRHALYNAVCESMMVEDLKREVEALNPNARVLLGSEYARGNPRLLDSSRFQSEFGFVAVPIRDRLRAAAPK
jgi:UDP-glucuronate 4-epimerase